jgi:hypothetical protein
LLVLVAGRQLRSREGLEVLALMTTASLPDGAPLASILEAVRAANAVVVLPWGFGKWWGRRGQILGDLVESADPSLCLGDSANRAHGWPDPFLLRRARERGLRVLPGSDPLPLRWARGDLGSYGFIIEGPIDLERPASSLRRLLDHTPRPDPFGRRVTLLRFITDQLALRLLPRGPAGVRGGA